MKTATQPAQHYTQNAWEGTEYQKHRNYGITEIAKDVRAQLKKQYPACKFSVTVEKYSGGQSLTIALMSAPFDAILKYGSPDPCTYEFIESTNPDRGYAQLNHYAFNENYAANSRPIPGWNNGCQLSRDAWTCMSDVYKFSSSFNYSDSDPQIDYFSVNFYLHLAIGKWDVPFKKIN